MSYGNSGAFLMNERLENNPPKAISSFSGGAVVQLRRAVKPLPGTSQEQNRSVKVDFVLLRSVERGTWTKDARNLFFALMHANVPAVNSLSSAYNCMERVIAYGALVSIQQRLGKARFPLIDQTYYSNHNDCVITPDFPIVVKLGYAHSGYGKMKLDNMTDFRDFAGVMALTPHYTTAESFIEWDWDGRVQKIGPHYRVFKRTSMNWKGNVGNMSQVSDTDLTEEFKMWADECAKLFGGLDILGLDFVHSKKDGKYYILELNDTAIGLVHAHAEEDMGHMRDVVLMRMEEHFGKQAAPVAASSSSSSTDLPTPGHDVAALEEQIKMLQVQIRNEKNLREEAEKRTATAVRYAEKLRQRGLISSLFGWE